MGVLYNSKYTDDMPEKALRWIREQRLPTVAGLCLHLDVSDDTIVNWSKKYPEFNKAYKELHKRAEEFLVQDGYERDRPTFNIFLLKANHGYIETARQEHTGKDGKDLSAGIFVGDIKGNGDDEDED